MVETIKYKRTCMCCGIDDFRIGSKRVVINSYHDTKLFYTNLVFIILTQILENSLSTMSTGAFAARKIRERNEYLSKMEAMPENTNCNELSPLKYNSKLMNSIWGLYNRYSVHNFKQNTAANNLIANVGEQQSSKDVVAVNGMEGKLFNFENVLPKMSFQPHV